MNRTPALLGATLLLLTSGALAQPAATATPGTAAAAGDTVYRCGPDGRSYSTTPCPGGKAVVVADPRDAQQQAQGREAAERERQLAERLGAERAQRERAVVPAAAGELGPRPPAAASAAKRSKKAADDQPRPKKPKKKKPKRAPAGHAAGERR